MSRLQTYFSSEFIASGLGTEFYEFITKITQAKSKTEESSHATEELATLSAKMGSPDISSTKMRDYLIRLIHCYMLGYEVDFSIIYAIMASQSGEKAGDKRVGYLACTLFLKNDNELGIMLMNTLQRDLKSQNYLDRCAALNAICYLHHAELASSVLDLVVQTMDFPKQIVRKKAVMTLYFLYENANVPVKSIEGALRQALDDKDSSVVFSALSVWKLILVQHAEEFQDLQNVFYSIHKQILENRVHKSFMYHGVLAPWAQMDCLSIYKIYHDMNIGSPKDLYDMIIECLESVEKKVDAAFAIVLECVKLLAEIDPILISSFAESDRPHPFDVLNGYLNAQNHNLKYLGLVGMACIDTSFWKEEWLDGQLLGDTIEAAFDDDTVIAKSIENLDSVIDSKVLVNASRGMMEALSRNHDNKACNTMIAYWLINRIVEYGVNPDTWFIETIIGVLAETRKNLDDDYVETQCSLLKETLLAEVGDTKLRESSVNATYRLLKKTNSDHLSPLLVQFSFWTLGENGYLSSTYSENDIMRQLQKWVVIVQDDYLQTCGLQAIKRCILRSKSWLAGLEKILKEYKRSPVPEKQEISRELLHILADSQFEKQLTDTDLTLSTSIELSANPNRPKGVNKFISNDDFHVDHHPRGTSDPQRPYQQQQKQQQQLKNASLTTHPKNNHSQLKYTTGSSGSSSSHSNQQTNDLVSSLLDFELNEEEITTEEFGKLWLEYTIERKQKFQCSVNDCEKLANKLSRTWRIHIIEVIGQEFIAMETTSLLLIHVTILRNHQFQLTMKAKESMQEISLFLSSRQLI